MKFINSSAELVKPIWLTQDSMTPEELYNDMMRTVELAGRVCYKSENKITEDSAEKFVRGLISRGHLSPLEHGTIHLIIPIIFDDGDNTPASLWTIFSDGDVINHKYWMVKTPDSLSPYPRYAMTEYAEGDKLAHVTTNLRAFIETVAAFKQWTTDQALDYLKTHMVPPMVVFGDGSDTDDTAGINPDMDYYRFTFHIICDRAVSHELVRHRSLSFSQESQRYVKYKGDIEFIAPSWLPVPTPVVINKYTDNSDKFVIGEGTDEFLIDHIYELWTPNEGRKLALETIAEDVFVDSCIDSANAYAALMVLPSMTPQTARGVLNNAVKTELYVTGSYYAWLRFLKLRNDKSAHPDMKRIAEQIQSQLDFMMPSEAVEGPYGHLFV